MNRETRKGRGSEGKLVFSRQVRTKSGMKPDHLVRQSQNDSKVKLSTQFLLVETRYFQLKLQPNLNRPKEPSVKTTSK